MVLKFKGKRIMIKKILKITLLMPLVLMAEVNMQESLYDAADEMIAFDNKMNKLIAEHNQYDDEDLEEMHKNDISIEDFEDTPTGYELNQKINDGNNTKVDVDVLDGILTITQVTKVRKAIENGFETTMSSSKVSLFIPNDADETKVQSDYVNGILKITISKKK